MIKQIATAICLFAFIAPALADDDKEETHAETPLPVLQSLPAEVQNNIEQVRTACRQWWRCGLLEAGRLRCSPPFLQSARAE
jgi:hypothetical protein